MPRVPPKGWRRSPRACAAFEEHAQNGSRLCPIAKPPPRKVPMLYRGARQCLLRFYATFKSGQSSLGSRISRCRYVREMLRLCAASVLLPLHPFTASIASFTL
jgi:hypothetical protein